MDAASDDLSYIPSILESGFADETGMVMLFIQTFKQLDIPCQVVLTCDKHDAYFDPEFENWNHLSDMLLYFPETGKYTMPANFLFRYGLIADNYLNQYALFIEEDESGGINGRIEKIRHSSFPISENNIVANVRFPGDFDEAIVDFEHSYTGQRAVINRAVYALSEKEEEKEAIAEALLKQIAEDAVVESWEVDNGELSTATIHEPFGVSGQMELPSILEKAGNKYLFKLGELIGPQVEMYQERERQMDIEMDHTVWYDRSITFTVPEGYTVRGLESINIDEAVEVNDQPVMRFVSSYEQTGNDVKVNVIEFYKEV